MNLFIMITNSLIYFLQVIFVIEIAGTFLKDLLPLLLKNYNYHGKTLKHAKYCTVLKDSKRTRFIWHSYAILYKSNLTELLL